MMLPTYSILVISPVIFFEDISVAVMSSHGKHTNFNIYGTTVSQMTASIF